MKSLPVIFFLVLTGCPANPIVPDTHSPGEGLVTVRTHVEAAQTHVEAAKPHADATGRVHLQNASSSLGEAITSLLDTIKANTQLVQDTEGLVKERDGAKSDLKAERARFFSHKQRQYAYWIIGGWVVLGVVGMLLKGLTGGWGLTIGTHLLRFLPLANLFSAGANKLRG